MQSRITSLIGIVDTVSIRVLALLFAALTGTVCWQVASRYLISTPSTATDELARLLFIWLGLLSAACASGRHKHLAMDLFTDQMPPAAHRCCQYLSQLLTILFALLILVYGGCQLMVHVSEMEQVTPVLELPVAWMYLALPVSGLLISLHSTGHLLNLMGNHS